MADERTVIFKLQLDAKALTDSAKQAEAELAKLQPQLKQVADESGKNSVAYRQLEAQVQKYTKQLKDSSAALAINEELAGKDTLNTNEQARAKKALSVAYNMLTEDEKQNTEEGRRLTAQLKATNEALQAQGLAVSDGRGSVGLYEKAIRAAMDSVKGLQKETATIGYAIGQNTKKLDDSTKALADMKAKGVDPTDAAYKRVSADVQFYTEALEQNRKTLSEVEAELASQTDALAETEKQAAKIGFVYGQQEEATKSLKQQVKDLKAELAQEVPGSDRFNEITAKAAALSDKMKDINEAVAAQATGSRFEQLSNQAGLLRDDLLNLDLEGVAEKARGFQAVASQITLKEITAGAKSAGSALVSLGKTLLTSPLFLLLAAGAALVVFWDDISAAIFKVSEEQEILNAATEAYNSTLEDFNKGATDASKKTLQVESAFKAAKNGVISKDEALKTYNDTLGDTFGKATDLNEAEAIYNAKTKEYVKNAGLRAQANALFAKAAEERVKTITGQTEFELSAEQAATLGYIRLTKGQEAATRYLTGLANKQIADQRKKSEAIASAIETEAQALLERAEVGDRAAGIQTESEQALADEMARLAKERVEKAKAAAEARVQAEREAAKAIRDLIIETENLNTELQQRELDSRTEYLRKLASIEETDAVKRAEKLLAIEQNRIAEQEAINQQAKADQVTQLKAAADEEVKALQGTADQKAEQQRLIRERLDSELLLLDVEFNDKALALTQQGEDAKQAVKDAQLAKDAQRSADRITILEAELVQEETRLREAGLKEEAIAKATQERRIAIAQEQNRLIQADAAKSDAEKLKAQADFEAEVLRIKKEGYDKDVEAFQAAEDQKKQLRQAVVDAAAQLVQELYAIEQQRLTEQLNAVTLANEAEQLSLSNKLEAGIISQEKYNAELKQLELKKAQEERKIKKEQFEKQKQADLIAAGIAISRAVISALATVPFFPVGVTMAGIAATLGAVQIAKIASAPVPAFATGGKVLSGQRIGFGDGTPIRRANGDNLLATVKANEVILNEAQQARAGGPDFFRRIGVPGFATGGATGSRISAAVQQNALNNDALIQAVLSIRPVVDVKDIIRETDRRSTVVSAGDLF